MRELDGDFNGTEVLVADTADGKPLSGARGRFRVMIPKDKEGARSVRRLTKLEAVEFEEVRSTRA